ncbi:iron dicitrate transport regulator FecR [Sphingomonas sp. Leaf412]|uniref:SIS domain-containing protein n=1 Tax=Sphingomonas sp. Leaf412 TaxID=1736370 RepID=UPI0006FDBA8A|nr:SIS domain-containing protein [Sphingomonas sp. Leaf412]KQT34635.1 iron dicitrate transport regulator FecR [Sphingomonas sp. Leaf412]
MADAVAGTIMGAEAGEAPAVVRRLLAANAAPIAALVADLRARPPAVVVTCARGSSDHAATYGKYLIETLVGIPVASAAPSVASVFQAPLVARDAVLIAVSQSGRSPDLLATVAAYRAAGARVVALVNDEGSPLAAAADVLLPLHAGTERAVAATKSCIAALAAFAQLASAWGIEDGLADALPGLPAMIDAGLAADWSVGADRLAAATRMFVIGRGYALGIAQEAALKLKETAAIQAEPFSAAEVRHGPMRIVGAGFPILGFATSDPAGADVATVAAEFAGRGAMTLLAGRGGILPARTGHPALEPVAMLASFYRMVERLTLARGLDPDSPPHLAKVTQTR